MVRTLPSYLITRCIHIIRFIKKICAVALNRGPVKVY